MAAIPTTPSTGPRKPRGKPLPPAKKVEITQEDIDDAVSYWHGILPPEFVNLLNAE